MLHMKIEQTRDYSKRMKYNSALDSFEETKFDSLMYVRKFYYPYGWIIESGTPPDKHWDVILMSEKSFNLGDVIQIKVIGVFLRKDNDHKFIAVLYERELDDYDKLSSKEKNDLNSLYPIKKNKEGFYGVEVALELLKNADF